MESREKLKNCFYYFQQCDPSFLAMQKGLDRYGLDGQADRQKDRMLKR